MTIAVGSFDLGPDEICISPRQMLPRRLANVMVVVDVIVGHISTTALNGQTTLTSANRKATCLSCS